MLVEGGRGEGRMCEGIMALKWLPFSARAPSPTLPARRHPTPPTPTVRPSRHNRAPCPDGPAITLPLPRRP